MTIYLVYGEHQGRRFVEEAWTREEDAERRADELIRQNPKGWWFFVRPIEVRETVEAAF